MDWRRYQFSLIMFFFFFRICIYAAIYTTNNNPQGTLSEFRCMSTLKAHNNYFQTYENSKNLEMAKGMKPSIGGARRLLGGPGSAPPRCTSKCGRCTPCKPVHVSVPPGMRVTTEYYPEAWRCKCGNRLYMP
ncbi:hypothetical protein BUALT_Bualt13G0100600 [Buddleja alternifolia]|uniref:Epidermal patterning factor-like protein n=1 Tax=Buddleja alternifolia TaxID=168488 RepID=A0AAV6WNA3_9LAMI|nr:hypothetical protein BUALT_Bualt13G0100600 [Buddleja alternifolia]